MISLSSIIRDKIVRLLLLHWRSNAIAQHVHCFERIVYYIQKNIFIYESSLRSRSRLSKSTRFLHKIVENSLIVYLKKQSWTLQKEIMWFLWEKWEIFVHRFTIFKTLKRLRWFDKIARRIDSRQNEKLRMLWVTKLLNVTIEQLIYIDESMFNETTSWRLRVYALVEQFDRYHVSRRREIDWSVLFAYIVDDYLFCTSIKEEWYNVEKF